MTEAASTRPALVGVTHSGDGADRLIRACHERGYAVIHVPLTEFAPVPDLEAVQRAVLSLPGGGWIILSSPHGAHTLTQFFQPAQLRAFRLAAVGEATANPLTQAGFRVRFVPSEASGAVLGRELPAEAGQTALHLTSDQARTDLQVALEARGLRYQRLTLYRTRSRTPSPSELTNLLRADVVMLASSSAAEQLAACGGQRLAVAVMGPQTARTARELGFQQVLVASRPGLPELLMVVNDYLEFTPQQHS